MKRIQGVTAAALVLGLATACSGGGEQATTAQTSGNEQPIIVLAAASTRVLSDDFNALSKQELSFVNAGSSTLVQQLIDGSPGDVLITADKPTMDRAVEAGVVADPKVVATNHIVLAVPRDNPAGITGVDESLRNAQVVACDSQVPCGRTTERFVEQLLPGLEFVSREHSVTDVLGKVTSGEADAGWVYSSDAIAAGDNVKVFDVPGASEDPNDYVAAVVVTSQNPDAARTFVDLIDSSDADALWSDRGFTPSP
ncbi:molybdate ABC transporter substrate-binding protein [Corynebacterium sp.]|uniref:molybdate ABC transporter substrate-binding protein n=1 Tax=Corynebacterium sp. TaxID=1720 RepID=UPI0026DA83E0|nr:molybdate ABC transporter substrate-binding protein [Corynebacterium sp.]MDO5076568.1 molybdate ABC transporter substrate-binding protein [Corynebacterium sp.]